MLCLATLHRQEEIVTFAFHFVFTIANEKEDSLNIENCGIIQFVKS